MIEYIRELPVNIIANIFTGIISSAVAGFIGFKGNNASAKENLVIDGTNGQVIYAPTNTGIIQATHINQSRSLTTNTVIKNYGFQNASSSSDDDSPWLYGTFAIMGIGVLLWASRFLPIIASLPLYVGGTVAFIASLTLILRRASFTTVALRKAVFAIFGLAWTSILTALTMVQAQNLANPYSLLSIANKAQGVAGNDKVLSGALVRALHLMSPGNQEYMYAFLLGIFTIIFSVLTFFYYLRIALGSLLFPASSNAQQFTGLLASLNTSFVKSSWLGMFAVSALACLMPWVASSEGTAHIFQWITTVIVGLQEGIKNL